MWNSKGVGQILIWTVVAFGLVLGGYYFFSSSPSSQVTPFAFNLFESNQTRPVPVGFVEYKNDRYKFSLLYPETLKANVVDEGGGASTITFQNPEAGQGFQVFVVPFFDVQITEERFLRDVPSGVRDNQEEIIIDGAGGVAFYSRDVLLGETREVWFLRNNYLYEVTTLKALEADLLEVLKTWQFLE